MLEGGGVSTQWRRFQVGERSVDLLCVADLAPHVDTAALLATARGPEPPYWMHVWPSARALARLLAAPDALVPAARVLEIGCGLALPAVVAALRGGRVTACDWLRAPLHFARRSARRNRVEMHCVQMSWHAPGLRARSFDVVLAADIGYDRADEGAIVAAIALLLRERGVVILADSVHTQRGSLPAALEAAGFALCCREVREWEDGHPVWVRLIEGRRGR